MDIKRLVKPHVRSLRPYYAAEIPCRVKLDANESPYPGSGGQGSEVRSKKILRTLNRYPDPGAKRLRKLVAEEYKVKAENIVHGNGSDELIYYLVTTFGGPVLYPVPTFSMYGIISQALGEKKVEIPLDKDFDLDTGKMLRAIRENRPGLIFLSSPNNPTGNSFSPDRILKLIDDVSSRSARCAVRSIVVIDEAYQPFSDRESFLPLLKKYKNLAILRTLSKVGLAGLRVGFLIADAEITGEVNKVRLPFNLNSISQGIAAEALKNRRLIRSRIKSIVSGRKKLLEGLNRIRHVKPYPSEANFILFRVKEPDKTYKGLLKKGVLVRSMKGIINGCLRVTVGTPAENAIFLKTLNRLL